MSDERIAAVYAGALFAAAWQQGAVERVRSEIAMLGQAHETSAELRNALLDPQIRLADKDRTLVALSEGASLLVVNTLRLLLVKGRMGLLGAVVREFERLAERAAAIVEVEVTSATALPEAVARDLSTRLEATTGRRVRVVKRVDRGIVGGLSLRIADEILVDASVKARMRQLREMLTGVSTRGASE